VRDRGPMGEVQRFIIRGIRPRSQPISPDGQDYLRCLWSMAPGQTVKCGSWHLTAEKMWEHILADHMGETLGEEKLFKNKEGSYSCHWGACTKYPQPTTLQLFTLLGHLKTHITAETRNQNQPLNTDSGLAVTSVSKRPKPREVKPAKILTLTYEETAMIRDERNANAPMQAAGIPLSAILVLRNIARNIVKTEGEEFLLKAHEKGGESGGWNERLFRPVVPRLYEIMTENRALAPNVASLLQLLEPL
jgi:chromatin structure-remodeling complex subunit RSC9